MILSALTDGMPVWERIADRFGIPVTLLLLFLFAIWGILKWGGKRIIEPMVSSHVNLVDALKKTNQINSDTNVRLANAQAIIQDSQLKILRIIDTGNKKITEAVKDQTTQLVNKLDETKP